MAMRATALLTLLLIASGGVAHADPRKLTLQEAVSLALHLEPLVNEAHLQDDRARLGVLRAQLDRFQLKADGSINELWNKSSIGLPPQLNCTVGTGAEVFTLPVATTADCSASALGAPAGTPAMITGTAPSSLWEGLSSFQIQANYFLFSGFRVEANVKRAKINEQSALVQIKQQRKDTALGVARAYWRVRSLIIQRDVQQQALQRMIDAEAIADGRLRAGLAPPIDKNRATQRKLAQMATLEDLAGQARAAAAQLGVTLGLGDDIELVDDVVIPEVPPASPVDLVRDALGRRPEVRNAQLQVDLQHQQVVMARSNFFPQLTIVGNFQYGNNVFNIASNTRANVVSANPFSGLSGAFYGGAALTMNFFDTLNTYTSTGDAKYLEEVNRQEVRRFERLVDSDVRGAYQTLLKLYAQRTPLTRARDVARDNLTIVEGRYKNGDALIIEYLDAQIDLANAELSLASVTAQLQLQWYELQASLGYIVGVDHG
jgi:outer membrane protein TolC